MTEQLKQYFLFISATLSGLRPDTNKAYIRHLIELHNLQINAFQHERLIHLLVTCFFACLLLAFTVMTVIWPVWQWIALDVIVLLLLGFYIQHYYFLENTLQKLYPMTQIFMHYLEEEIPQHLP
ncbi:MAG: hypothetical protein ACRCWR_02300 [Saezia sp.]